MNFTATLKGTDMTMATTESTVRELVIQSPGRAQVFERLGIDYCCGGRKPLSEACREKNLDVDTVLGALQAADLQATDETDWTKASMTKLADHIESTHHAYLKTELSRLSELLPKIANVHGQNHPELADVYATFRDLRDELLAHMMKEEQILFPMIRQLDQSAGPGAFHCGSIQNPIRVMIMEHDSAGDALARLRRLTQDYRLPADACASYHAAYDSLAKLELDLHQHIHKENNILFPRAIAAEGER